MENVAAPSARRNTRVTMKTNAPDTWHTLLAHPGTPSWPSGRDHYPNMGHDTQPGPPPTTPTGPQAPYPFGLVDASRSVALSGRWLHYSHYSRVPLNPVNERTTDLGLTVRPYGRPFAAGRRPFATQGDVILSFGVIYIPHLAGHCSSIGYVLHLLERRPWDRTPPSDFFLNFFFKS